MLAYFVLGYPNGEPLAMLLNTATMEFFSSTFSVYSGEAGRGARLWLVSFFMRTKARRDRVIYLCRSTRFARGYLYFYKVFAFYFDHTLGTLFFKHNSSTFTRVTQASLNSSGLPMRTLPCS